MTFCIQVISLQYNQDKILKSVAFSMVLAISLISAISHIRNQPKFLKETTCLRIWFSNNLLKMWESAFDRWQCVKQPRCSSMKSFKTSNFYCSRSLILGKKYKQHLKIFNLRIAYVLIWKIKNSNWKNVSSAFWRKRLKSSNKKVNMKNDTYINWMRKRMTLTRWRTY